MADGFLGRWSQRKQALREGRAVQEPTLPKTPDPAIDPNPAGLQTSPAPAQDAGVVPPKPAPAPTLEDVKALNADSSFAPFVSRDVAPDVRNAAMKKLFTDPHYNVMDGLDIYIDDYSKADPIPADMLRQMASAKFLNLFDEDPVTEVAPDSAPATSLEDPSHDHTDLRLQPDHAARPEGPEREPERTPDAAFQPVPPRGR
jgi:hypothetical protein